jgi:hypothetical protein
MIHLISRRLSDEESHEMFDWLTEQAGSVDAVAYAPFGQRVKGTEDLDSRWSVVFREPEDAVFFKLKWC